MADFHEINYRCKDSKAASCAERVRRELLVQNCKFQSASIKCETSNEDKAFYCSALSSNCLNSHSNGFTGALCSDGILRPIKDRKLSATWAVSIFWIWVRSFCKENN